MRDGVGVGMFAAELGDADTVGFTCFGHGVIAAVEVFALLFW